MLVLSALAYMITLMAAMFWLALRTTRGSSSPSRNGVAETGGFEPPRELNTP